MAHTLYIEERFMDDGIRATCSCGWQGEWRLEPVSRNERRVLCVNDHTAHIIETKAAVRCNCRPGLDGSGYHHDPTCPAYR